MKIPVLHHLMLWDTHLLTALSQIQLSSEISDHYQLRKQALIKVSNWSSKSKLNSSVFDLQPFIEVSTLRDYELFAFHYFGYYQVYVAATQSDFFTESAHACFLQQQPGIKQHFNCKAVETTPSYPWERTIPITEISETLHTQTSQHRQSCRQSSFELQFH